MSNKVPQIRFNGYSDPWEERKLGDIFVYKQGQQVPVENQFTKRGKNRHRFIRIVDLTTKNEAPRYIEYSGDNIISSTDLFMIRYGQPGVIGYGYEGVIANNLFKLIPKIETYNLFFKYILDSMYPKIQSLSSSTTMPAISFKSLDVLAVKYPDKKEQAKIGSFFAQLDNTIALHQRKLDLLKEQKKGYLQKMFPKNGAKVPELRFAGFADDWEERKLSDMANVKTGFPFKNENFVDDGQYLVITNGNIQNDSAFVDGKVGNRITAVTDEIKEKYTLNYGDILVTMDGTVGRTAKVVEGNQILAQRVGRLVSESTPEFIYQWLNTGKFFTEMNKVSHGGTIKHISLSEIGDYVAYVPTSKDEREKIGSLFLNIDKTITLHQRKLDLLKEQKKGFLQKMFV